MPPYRYLIANAAGAQGASLMALLLCLCAAGLDGTRGQSMPGGVSGAVSPSEHDRFEASAQVAVDQLNARSNAVPGYTLGRIASVRKQVVAGTMLYITYEAVREGVPRTEVCDAKVWHKLDDTRQVMSNSCTFVVVSVNDYGEGNGKREEAAGEAGPRLTGGFQELDHHSQEARSAAAEYAIQALGMGRGRHGSHARSHSPSASASADGPRGLEKVFLCSAEKQIVNGVNYKLKLGTKGEAGGGAEAGEGAGTVEGVCDITAEVYKNFDGVFEVVTQEV